MTFKRTVLATIIAISSFSAVAEEVKSPNFTDYLGGNLSYNNRMGADDVRVGDTNYAELELWAGKGNVHFYGYYDYFEDGATFTRLDPKWFVGGGKFFANYQYSSFAVENGAKDETHYVGAGYRFALDKGFIDASLNVGRTDHESQFGEAAWQGDGGMAVLTNGSYNLGDGWTVGGWSDYKFNLDERVANGSSYTWSGNVGPQKTFSNNMYVRLAPQWMHDENGSDVAIHSQIGYTF